MEILASMSLAAHDDTSVTGKIEWKFTTAETTLVT